MRFLVLTIVVVALVAIARASSIDVSVPSLSAATTPFPHFWKRCFGSGHARLALRADWQDQLQEMRNELGIERVRFHGIFDDDIGVVLDRPDNYEFFNVDQIYKPMVAMGVKPIVELSFMPALLAGCDPYAANGHACKTVMHYKGIVVPPTNFSQWTGLVQNFAQHLVDVFGAEEVRTWHFEVWNELWGMPYPTDYLQLYDASRVALKAVDTQLQIGGPVTMQCQYISEFVSDRAGKFDFVSTHLYPTDPNCTAPGNRGDIDCFANTIKRARAQAPSDKPFFVTEFNAGLFRAELLYSSYAAAFIFRNVPQLSNVIDIWSYWTFTDIFEESGMHGAPFAGFNYGIQTNRGIKKPVYRAFQLLHGIGDTSIASTVTYDGSKPPANATVTAFAVLPNSGTLDNIGVHVFVSNFAPEDFLIAASNATVAVPGASCAGATAAVWTIDAENANAYAAWEARGSPSYPTDTDLAFIKNQSVVRPRTVALQPGASDGTCVATVDLLPYSAVRIDFPKL